MPRKANDDIGTCPCPTCHESRPVRKEKSGMLYIWCASPCKSKCHAQDYILSNGNLNGKPAIVREQEPGEGAEEVLGPVVQVPATEPEPARLKEPRTSAPAPVLEPRARKGFFQTILD